MVGKDKVRQTITYPNLIGFPIIIQERKENYPVAGQCDCACTLSLTTFVEELAPTEGDAIFPSATVGLEDGYWALQASTLQYNPLVLNRSAFALAHYLDTGPSLSVLERLTTVGLLMPGSQLTPPPDALAAWLHLTTACNLACDYCYLPKCSANMSPDTGRAAIDAVFRSALAHGYHTVKLKYAGGEPLLMFPRVVELLNFCTKIK